MSVIKTLPNALIIFMHALPASWYSLCQDSSRGLEVRRNIAGVVHMRDGRGIVKPKTLRRNRDGGDRVNSTD
ncbi:hypothetical protein AAE026_37060 [Bradyrhizobium sp. DN5]|uniref:hypothetical protein n=1 Tax=Bradyrhizobium sp. DN5 TaxID=3056950 RepID=UPI0035255C79